MPCWLSVVSIRGSWKLWPLPLGIFLSWHMMIVILFYTLKVYVWRHNTPLTIWCIMWFWSNSGSSLERREWWWKITFSNTWTDVHDVKHAAFFLNSRWWLGSSSSVCAVMIMQTFWHLLYESIHSARWTGTRLPEQIFSVSSCVQVVLELLWLVSDMIRKRIRRRALFATCTDSSLICPV
jgi:hypothetical protein